MSYSKPKENTFFVHFTLNYNKPKNKTTFSDIKGKWLCSTSVILPENGSLDDVKNFMNSLENNPPSLINKNKTNYAFEIESDSRPLAQENSLINKGNFNINKIINKLDKKNVYGISEDNEYFYDFILSSDRLYVKVSKKITSPNSDRETFHFICISESNLKKILQNNGYDQGSIENFIKMKHNFAIECESQRAEQPIK